MSNYTYREFVRYYQEVNNNLEKLVKEIGNQKFWYSEVKPETQKELERHELMINILGELAQEKYNKTHHDLISEKLTNLIIIE